MQENQCLIENNRSKIVRQDISSDQVFHSTCSIIGSTCMEPVIHQSAHRWQENLYFSELPNYIQYNCNNKEVEDADTEDRAGAVQKFNTNNIKGTKHTGRQGSNRKSSPKHANRICRKQAKKKIQYTKTRQGHVLHRNIQKSMGETH